MWNMKRVITPVIIGATGMVTKGLKKNLEATAGKNSTDSLQKTAVLVTSHILRKVLQSETGSPSGGESQLVEAEKYRREKACDRRHIIILIIIIIIIIIINIQ